MVIEVNEEALDDDDLDSESESTSEPWQATACGIGRSICVVTTAVGRWPTGVVINYRDVIY
jgi:hypothetical protein